MNVVLVATDRAVPFSAGGFHIASYSSDDIVNGMAFSLTPKMEVINEVEVTKLSDAKGLCFLNRLMSIFRASTGRETYLQRSKYFTS